MVLEIGFGATVLSGVVWAIRQEGRINLHEHLLVAREQRLDERHEELKVRLDRIEAAVFTLAQPLSHGR